MQGVTAADVARIAGVAKSTVSLAFSAPDRVAVSTLQRILKTAEQHGYRPNPVAQSLKTGRNNSVGLLLQDLTNPHSGAVLQHVQTTAGRIGYMVMTATAAGDPKSDLRFVRHLERLKVPAAIINSSGSDAAYVNKLIESPMRFVTYGHKLSALECDHVGLDNHRTMQLLVRHLLDLGHRKIGHVAGDQTISSAVERLVGVREHLAAAGLELSDRHLAYGDYDENLAYSAARSLLMRDDRPTALITANNVTAIGALRAVRDLNMSCPRDVSIATVDRLPWGDLFVPELTCAAQPIDEMANLAATWLIERLENETKSSAPRLREFVPELIVGGSTSAV